MSEQERTILQYLENSYTGARMLDDISAMTRIARAIAAFEADLTEDILAAEPDLSEYCDKLWKTAYERGKEEAHPKKGKWIDDGTYGDYHPHHTWHCSECEQSVIEIGTPGFKFCPNCGARMMEERDELTD